MRKISISIFLLMLLVLTSCNLPSKNATPTNAADAILTAAAQTVEVQLTRGVSMSTPGPTLPADTAIPPTQAVASTSQPQPTQPTQTLAPSQPSATAAVCDRADFVEDITIPDGTIMVPGEQFTKTWRLRNTGTCTWTTGYSIVFERENLMGAPTSVALPKTVQPGETVDVSVVMTAPIATGKYSGHWKLRNANNTIFGLGTAADKSFYVQIEVAAAIFAVTGVYGSVQPATFEGACSPASLKFKADIRVNKAGTITYVWRFSNGSESAVYSLTFSEAGTKTVEYTREFTEPAGEYTGWAAVYIDDPNHQEFGKINYTLKCQ